LAQTLNRAYTYNVHLSIFLLIMAKPVVLCVDDEKTVLISLRQELEFGLGREFTFELAESAEEGLEIFDEIHASGMQVSVVISDQIMPGMKGDEFLAEVARRSPATGRILLTGESGYAHHRQIANGKLFVTLAKPWDLHELRNTLLDCAKATA
jgi:two-component system sensor histidine kinase/response regulator